jgi:D-methionine transport system substrate-binding protein
LSVLAVAGLITLNPAADKWEATQKDIAANPEHLKFTLLDSPRVAITVRLGRGGGLHRVLPGGQGADRPADLRTAGPDEFAGQLTIGSRWAGTENIKNLVATFKDPAVQLFLATDPSVKNILLPL